MHKLIVSQNELVIFGLSRLIKENLPGSVISSAKCIKDARSYYDKSCKLPDKIKKIEILLIEKIYLNSLLTHKNNNPETTFPPCIIFGVSCKKEIDICKKHNIENVILTNDATSHVVETIKNLAVKVHKSKIYDPLELENSPLYFTAQQKKLIYLLLLGYSNKKIAHALDLS